MSLLRRNYEARLRKEAIRQNIIVTTVVLAGMLLMFTFGFHVAKHLYSATSSPALSADGRSIGGGERAFSQVKGLFTRSPQAARAGEV